MARTDPNHARWMMHALRLAQRGRGRVEPNPMVGCIIVRDGRIIGEGWHQQYGQPHAEPNALASCAEDPHGATAYVTLEPCSHTGKQTPPCAPRLIEAGLGRVVIGCLDPNPQVNGRGVAILREAGIAVESPVLEHLCRQLIAPFIARVKHHRPYVTLKWAQSRDGRIAGPGGVRRQISGPAASRIIHQLRARCDALLVGIGTVLADDPMLTCRLAEPLRPLLRVVLDSHLRLPTDSRLVHSAAEHLLRVYTGSRTETGAWQQRHVDVRTIVTDSTGRISIPHMLQDLSETGVTHLLVEPGPTLGRSWLAGGLVDRLWRIMSPTTIDDDTAPAAPGIPPGFIQTGSQSIDGDTIEEWLNPDSAVYFAQAPSADFEQLVGVMSDE